MRNPTEDDEKPIIDPPLDAVRAAIRRRDAQFCDIVGKLGVGAFGGVWIVSGLACAVRSADPAAARDRLLGDVLDALDRLLRTDSCGRGDWQRVAALRRAVLAERVAAFGVSK